MSLGFHVPPDAFAAEGDITAVKTQSEGNNLEHDTSVGKFSSLVQVDSDTYALAYTGSNSDGYISTFTISPTSPANAPTSLTASVNSDVQIVLQWTVSTTLGTGILISMSVQRDDGSGWLQLPQHQTLLHHTPIQLL